MIILRLYEETPVVTTKDDLLTQAVKEIGKLSKYLKPKRSSNAFPHPSAAVLLVTKEGSKGMKVVVGNSEGYLQRNAPVTYGSDVIVIMANKPVRPKMSEKDILEFASDLVDKALKHFNKRVSAEATPKKSSTDTSNKSKSKKRVTRKKIAEEVRTFPVSRASLFEIGIAFDPGDVKDPEELARQLRITFGGSKRHVVVHKNNTISLVVGAKTVENAIEQVRHWLNTHGYTI